jgi:L-iditol 2-dehydrogenase
VDGAFAKYVKVPTRIIHKLPERVSLRQACLTEPLCVAYKAVIDNSTIRPGDTVVVIGPGPIGLLSVRMAKLAGASQIVAIGTEGDDKRLQMAIEFGATFTINSSNQDPLPQILALGDGYGADLIIDTAGPAETLALSMQAVRPGGQITKIGWGPGPVNFSLDPLISKSVTLKGHFSHTWDVWEKCLTLIANGQADIETLITHELSIEEWEKAFELVESKQAVKVILKPVD